MSRAAVPELKTRLEAAIEDGFAPDIISTDAHQHSVTPGPAFDLLTVAHGRLNEQLVHEIVEKSSILKEVRAEKLRRPWTSRAHFFRSEPFKSTINAEPPYIPSTH